MMQRIICGAWWLIGRVNDYRPNCCLTPALAATKGPWASPSLTVAYGTSAWNSGTVSVPCRERLWV